MRIDKDDKKNLYVTWIITSKGLGKHFFIVKECNSPWTLQPRAVNTLCVDRRILYCVNAVNLWNLTSVTHEKTYWPWIWWHLLEHRFKMAIKNFRIYLYYRLYCVFFYKEFNFLHQFYDIFINFAKYYLFNLWGICTFIVFKMSWSVNFVVRNIFITAITMSIFSKKFCGVQKIEIYFSMNIIFPCGASKTCVVCY